MAKLAFTKLALKKQDNIKTINFNDQVIEIRQYLPINDKMNLITRIIQNTQDENNFANPLKVEVSSTIEIIMAYTNINFTDKQKEDIRKLYDLFTESGLTNMIIDAIPEDEFNFVIDSLWECIDSVYGYQNSAMGILESVARNKDALEMDLAKIQEVVNDKDSLTLLKDVLTNLG